MASDQQRNRDEAAAFGGDYTKTLQTFASLQPGDRVQVRHLVQVGFRNWISTTRGTVVRKDRRRHSLHFRRNFDDKVFSDVLVLQRDDGELTTVTMDEFSQLERLSDQSAPA